MSSAVFSNMSSFTRCMKLLISRVYLVTRYYAKGMIALVMFYCLSCAVNAQQLTNVKIATIGFPPYGIKSDAGLSGIYFDVANWLMKDAGYDSTNVITPYARIISGLISGQNHLTIMFKYSELENFVTYVAALPTLKIVVMGLEGSHFESIANLKGKSIAYLRGASFSREIDDNPDLVIHRVTDFSQAIRMLLASHVDVIIGPMDPILAAAANMGIAEYRFSEPLIIDERTPWVQLSNKSTEFVSVEKLKASFEKLTKQGVLEKLRADYLKVKK